MSIQNYSVSMMAGRDPLITVTVDAQTKVQAEQLGRKIFDLAKPLIHEHYKEVFPHSGKARFWVLTINNEK